VDHVAAQDQRKASVEHSRRRMIESWIQLSYAKDMRDRQHRLIERSIERVATSRVRIGEARRTLRRS
jgi:hypothetical protein